MKNLWLLALAGLGVYFWTRPSAPRSYAECDPGINPNCGLSGYRRFQ